jgi:3'-phosphoadenosine 5'-phosphosulfate sulfotransferase (PAPS reductase)/FAD synthetase
MNNILSISGGKDSTAMMLEMLERGEIIHSAVFFDTEWEFPQMYEHIAKLEKYTGIKIWRLHSRLSFDYWLIARPVIARKGPHKGEVHRIGNGWPSPSRRWCTRQKADALNLYTKAIEDPVCHIGYAADETRSLSDNQINYRFPLQEYGITEAQALEICYAHGFDWGGLYNLFRRVSCFCCPLQRIGELRTLRREFPELWQRMLDMEDAMGEGAQRGFKDYTTVRQLDQRFADEDRQQRFFDAV